MQAIRWLDESLGAQFTYEDIPADLAEQAAEYRKTLVELAVEQDDVALEASLEGEEPSADVLKACIRKGAIAGSFVPVLLGSSFKNTGVQPLLDGVVDSLPSPTAAQTISERRRRGK